MAWSLHWEGGRGAAGGGAVARAAAGIALGLGLGFFFSMKHDGAIFSGCPIEVDGG